MNITRENLDALLDSGRIECAMSNGKWWRIRRNGSTRRWKRDPARIRVPYKAGFRSCGTIEESDFNPDGSLKAAYFRVAA